ELGAADDGPHHRDVLAEDIEHGAAQPGDPAGEGLDGVVVDPVERDQGEAAAEQHDEEDEEGQLSPVALPERGVPGLRVRRDGVFTSHTCAIPKLKIEKSS